MQKLSTSRKKAKPVEGGKVGAAFSLEDVQYTSPTEAAAQFYNCHTIPRRVCTTIIATTQDGWAHAAGVAIPDGLADLVSYTPLGRGAVAIKAEEQLVRQVLSPTGKLTPLHVTHEPRALCAGSDLIGAWNLPFEVGARGGMWAADVDAMELYPVLGAPGVTSGSTPPAAATPC